MKPNFTCKSSSAYLKLISLILLCLLGIIFNGAVVFKAYQLLSASNEGAFPEAQSPVDFDQLHQTLGNLKQRKPLEFGK